MVELIVVLILVGILGAVAVSRFFDRQTFDAAGFADQSRAMLRYAQKVAIAQNRRVFVQLDGQSIRLCFTNSFPCAANLQVRTPSVRNQTTNASCPSDTWACVRQPDGITYTVSPETGGGAPFVLSFDALGRPFAGAATNVSTGLTLTVSGQPPINVARETGYVF